MQQIKLNKQNGITLVEVLVTVIIFSIGLLGLATMQNMSVKLSYESFLRTQASFIAYDLVDRIRANPEAKVYTLSNGESLQSEDCSYGKNCTAAQLRDYDLYQWYQQTKELLPNADVEVVYDDSQELYSLKIRWDDRISRDEEKDDQDGVSDESELFVYSFKIGD